MRLHNMLGCLPVRNTQSCYEGQEVKTDGSEVIQTGVVDLKHHAPQIS